MCVVTGAQDLQSVDLSYNRLFEFRSDPFARNSRIKLLDLSHNQISEVHQIIHLEVSAGAIQTSRSGHSL